jgi:hypothetical protein
VVPNPRGQDSLVLTKFDLLEAFKGHGDLVMFLQEQINSKQRVKDVKSMLLETPEIVHDKEAEVSRQNKL